MSKEDTGEGKGVMSSALLLAAVAVVLVTGMVLKTEAPRNLPPAGVPASPAPSLPLGSTITPELAPEAPADTKADPDPEPEPSPAATADPLTVKLASRAEADCGRLAKAHGRWTAQLLVACKPETVDRMLGMAHESSALYVLPVQVKDDPCFRVCFGAYATSKEAALAADLPKALRGKERIGPVEIAKVLP